MNKINASEFKAKCLGLFDDIARTGKGMTILKRGRPVAQVLPVVPREARYPQDTLRGSVEIRGDIVAPVLPSEAWEAEGKVRS